MKLVLAGEFGIEKKVVDQLLSTYKHRNDVLLQSEEKERIIAAAYAMIYTTSFKTYCIPVWQAIHCHVPIIAAQEPTIEECTQSNALWFTLGAVNELAEQMMHIYKDENERNRLIQNGRQNKQNHSMEIAADKLWQILSNAIGKQ